MEATNDQFICKCMKIKGFWLIREIFPNMNYPTISVGDYLIEELRMKKIFLIRLILSLWLFAAAFSAHAVTETVLGTNFVDGQLVYNTIFSDGTSATFVGSKAFQKKTQAGMTGVGISGGRTAGEIDIDETLTATFSKEVIFSTLTIGLLFDGPEYNDVMETAKFLVNFADGGIETFYLKATGTHTASWTGEGSILSLGNGAVDGGTGAWELTNPFGSRAVDSIVFSAYPGIAKAGCHGCTNQSDFTFVSATVTAVPEAQTSAMMFAGLLFMGVLGLRRNKA